MVETMKPGAAVIDVAIDQGGCVETSRPTTIAEPTFVYHGVTHYCVPNLTADMGRSTSVAAAQAILPYMLRIGDLGIDKAIERVPDIARGVYTHQGKWIGRGAADAVSRWNSRRNLLPSAPAFLRWPVAGLLIRCGLTNSTSPSCMASYPSAVGVLRFTTVHGPALSRVTGTACPSGRNICVIPIFLPRIPGLIIQILLIHRRDAEYAEEAQRTQNLSCASLRDLCALCVSAVSLSLPERLNFHIHTRRQIELHQRVYRLLGRL